MIKQIQWCVLLIAMTGYSSLSAPAYAEVLGYWDFNDDNLALNTDISTQTPTMSLFSLTVGSFNPTDTGYLASAAASNQPGVISGDALRLFQLGDVYEDWILRMSGFDFTGLQGAQFVVDLLISRAFAAVENTTFQYSLDGGSNWITFFTIDSNTAFPPGSWVSYAVDLPEAVDGQDGVDFRINHDGFANILSDMRYDNVTITAIPEPASVLLLGLGATIGLMRRRR